MSTKANKSKKSKKSIINLNSDISLVPEEKANKTEMERGNDHDGEVIIRNSAFQDNLARFLTTLCSFLDESAFITTLASFTFSGFDVKAVVEKVMAICGNNNDKAKKLVLLMAYGIQRGPNVKGINRSLANVNIRADFQMALSEFEVKEKPEGPNSITISRLLNSFPSVAFQIFVHLKNKIKLPISAFVISDDLNILFFNFICPLIKLNSETTHLAMFLHCLYAAKFTRAINKKKESEPFPNVYSEACKYAILSMENPLVLDDNRTEFVTFLESKLKFDKTVLKNIIKAEFGATGVGKELFPMSTNVNRILNKFVSSNSDINNITESHIEGIQGPLLDETALYPDLLLT